MGFYPPNHDSAAQGSLTAPQVRWMAEVCLSDSLDEPELVPFLAQQGLGRHAEPALDDRGIDRAEIGGEAEVSVVDEFRQVWRIAIEPALNAISQGEHDAGRAVIGSAVGVLLHAAAEFAPREHK